MTTEQPAAGYARQLANLRRNVLREEEEMRIIVALVATCLFLSGCGSTPDKVGVPTTVRRCPNGHTTIQIVPITYGRIVLTPELREKDAKHEVAFAGCDENSRGKFKIVCVTCGANTYEGDFPWYDKDTKVIPSGDAVK
jgi:hypothetical protein